MQKVVLDMLGWVYDTSTKVYVMHAGRLYTATTVHIACCNADQKLVTITYVSFQQYPRTSDCYMAVIESLQNLCSIC